MTDAATRFSLDTIAVRGAYIVLNKTLNETLELNAYPEAVQKLLAEFLATSAAIGELSQFDGVLTLQARSDNGINLIMSEHQLNGNMRAIARGHETAMGTSFTELLGEGILTMTLDPKVGKRYQGIIALDKITLAENMGDYFKQSEQLDTYFLIRSFENGISALVLQAMPDTDHNSLSEDDWNTVITLADSLTEEECQTLSTQDLLYRLFHEFSVRVQAPRELQYQCSCSKERMINALKSVSEADVRDFLKADGKIDMSCDFCNNGYTFFEEDIDNFFNSTSSNKNTQNVIKLH